MGPDSYDRVVVVAQVLVTLWLAVIVVRALRALARGDRRSVLFVVLVFAFFFGVPQVLDLLVGAPKFTYQRGFVLSQYDRTTNLVYLGYLAVVPLVFLAVGGRPRVDDRVIPATALRGWVRLFAWTTMLALPFVVLLSPDAAQYSRYAVFVGSSASVGVNPQYHVVVSLAALLAAIAAVLVLSAPNTLPVLRLATLPFLSLAIWVQGKRSIVALSLLLLLYLLWTRGYLRGRRFVAAALAAVLALGVFSYTYQSAVRDAGDERPGRVDTLASSAVYVGFRIDYGRDAVTKQAIYAELHPDDIQILEYRGQSILFDLTFFVPRAMWPGKPYPYATYVTSAMFGFAPRDLGWGVTTSWLEEAIANVGWLGLLLGPLLPALICRLGDRQHSPFSGLLTVIVASLFLVLNLIAFMPIFLIWIVVQLRAPARETRAAPMMPQPGMLKRRR